MSTGVAAAALLAGCGVAAAALVSEPPVGVFSFLSQVVTAAVFGGVLRASRRINPDAIFMLSDGELQDNSLQMLRQINSIDSDLRQIPIHTVHLMSEFGRETLEIIAKENQGTFTPIEGTKPFGRFRRR